MLRSLAIRKTSLIDFPGRVAAVFFLPGCDFRCPYCHNAELVDLEDPPEGLTPLEEALAFLERRKGLLGGLVLSGGEPLLHPEAARIAAARRDGSCGFEFVFQ
ncbi:MAG TPA: radical SAM protein, partial [Spirochaetia bacterium]|nr:radical SAM protein [Spirochaetia bacterium]